MPLCLMPKVPQFASQVSSFIWSKSLAKSQCQECESTHAKYLSLAGNFKPDHSHSKCELLAREHSSVDDSGSSVPFLFSISEDVKFKCAFRLFRLTTATTFCVMAAP
jgi:hypothetical protein